MKRHISLLILLFIVVNISNAKERHVPVSSCVYVSETDNTITVRTTGYGEQKIDAIEAAEKYAVETVLFRGVPDSKRSRPLVNINEQSAKQNNSNYFEDLFTNGRYKSFIVSSSPVVEYSKDKQYKMWNITTDIKINVKALSKDLETQGVVRRFGY